ncbi:MAG: cohesin domain-containing protein [Candidatus Latescibacterota bacterium]|nr:cohesin domain-containing protein [Candidatus Latescibacterota bacterium]
MNKYLTAILPVTLMLCGVTFTQEEPAETEPSVPLSGPARLDLNTTAGDQSQRQTFTVPETGSIITVDVALAEGGNKRSGFDIVLTYDAFQLAVQNAQAVDLFEGAFLMPSQEEGQLGLTALLLGSTSGIRDNGSIAQVTFKILDSFSGESHVVLESALLGTAFKIDSIQVGTQTSIVTVGGEITTVVLDKPDFDGDGTVGFTDFLIFAGGFGAVTGDQNFNPILDLDQSGEVGFADFLVFAQAFGT